MTNLRWVDEYEAKLKAATPYHEMVAKLIAAVRVAEEAVTLAVESCGCDDGVCDTGAFGQDGNPLAVDCPYCKPYRETLAKLHSGKLDEAPSPTAYSQRRVLSDTVLSANAKRVAALEWVARIARDITQMPPECGNGLDSSWRLGWGDMEILKEALAELGTT